MTQRTPTRVKDKRMSETGGHANSYRHPRNRGRVNATELCRLSPVEPKQVQCNEPHDDEHADPRVLGPCGEQDECDCRQN